MWKWWLLKADKEIDNSQSDLSDVAKFVASRVVDQNELRRRIPRIANSARLLSPAVLITREMVPNVNFTF